MRNRPFLLALLVILMAVLAFRAAVWASDRAIARTAIDPSKASAFLQAYSPQPVIHAFANANSSSWTSDGIAAAGGADSVRNDRQFKAGFPACRSREAALTSALDEDLLTQLRLNKAAILFHTGNPQTGFHMVYRLGRTLGVVHLKPVSPDTVMRRVTPLPAPIEDMTTDLSISETWFRTDKAASTAFRKTGLLEVRRQ